MILLYRSAVVTKNVLTDLIMLISGVLIMIQ